ncbi:LysR family transcriptional regulator [Paraburkholderia ginsengiterrae]|uniref:LysR family transcriptional regulator n=1 Tax=Paraburkholderia ginsengiterrae TaxID=1462993 RepID=A0A1A9MW68_9BURK|nr:LysR family transcriptional regulator [Paraburkholderia ginsengiterrae]OAJ52085.1 LysR family transcriptional regulator [Paraburkholderia ginsengiterrae]OAJ63449.1 LysR family transcriptional regulator [Paraburkholderia ginsengiterrae]
MDRLASMAAFVKTVEVGSFATAASALNMSPQMIAKHVTWLESRLGTRLLNRTTRRQSLTDIGKAYYDRCKLVLADADWADSLADEAKGAPRGRLRVNAPVSFGTHRLTPVIARYLRQYPTVEVDLVLSDRFVDLVEEEFEAVFRVGPLVDSSFIARELAPFRLVACASPDYLRERGVPAVPTDLETHECLVYASTSAPAVSEWRFVRGDENYQIDVKHRLRVNDAKALLVAALNGFGVAFIAEDLVGESLRSGRLVKVLPDYETPSRPIHLIYHPDRRQTPKLKSFISAVIGELGK